MIGWIISWIIVGGILGAAARLVMPGPDPMSVGATILLGIAGELVAGVIFGLVFGVGAGWIAGLLATVGLLYLSRRTGYGTRRGSGRRHLV